MKEKTILPHGCHVGKINVNPADWRKKKGILKDDWYISYRFVDPKFRERHPKGFQVIIKGMNEAKDAAVRIVATEGILRERLFELQSGYNPITRISTPAGAAEEVSQHTSLAPALKFALRSYTAEDATKKNYTSILKFVCVAINQLGYSILTVSDVEVGHIKRILEKCSKNRDLSNSMYNKYRTCLMGLFRELVQYGAIKFNPVKEIIKREEVTRIKDVLTDEERNVIVPYLFKNYYPFWRYAQIFYGCAARTTENLAVRIKDIDLPGQRYKITFKKGRSKKEIWKVIPDDLLPLFHELTQGAKQNDYLFSRNLTPGPVAIHPKQISKRWYRLVKSKTFMVEGEERQITKDFNSLRHMRLTKVTEYMNESASAKLGGTSAAMVVKIYDTKNKERKDDIIKKFKDRL